jgi:hypothetical protein
LNPDAPATCGMPTAASGLISDFASAGATGVSMAANGGTDLWSVTPGGTGTSAAGEFHAVTTMGSWASAGTGIGKGICLDMASKYAGIKFKIRSTSNTALIFAVQTPETKDDASNYRKQIAVTPTSTELTIAFTDLVKPPFGIGLGLPSTYKPATRMVGIVLGVGVQMEKMDIFLDDVTFY